MMSIHKLLGGLLAVQAGLAVITWWPSSNDGGTLHPLFELGEDTVTALTITGAPRADGEVPQVELSREQGSWVLTSAGGYPADDSKVSEVLDKLLSMKVRKPLATQKANHNALEVGEDEYGKRIHIAAGSQAVDLVLGAATSDAVNVRLADADEVYQAKGFSIWSIGDSDRRYYDSLYIDTSADDVRVLTVTAGDATLQLDQVDDTWISPDLAEGQALDQDEVQKLVKDLVQIRVSEPLGKELKPEYGLDNGVKVEWTTEEGEQTVNWGYTVGAEDDSQYYLQGQDNPFVVKVRKSRFEDLGALALSDLLAADEAEE